MRWQRSSSSWCQRLIDSQCAPADQNAGGRLESRGAVAFVLLPLGAFEGGHPVSLSTRTPRYSPELQFDGLGPVLSPDDDGGAAPWRQLDAAAVVSTCHRVFPRHGWRIHRDAARALSETRQPVGSSGQGTRRSRILAVSRRSAARAGFESKNGLLRAPR